MSQLTQAGFIDLLEDLLDLNYEPNPYLISFAALCGFLFSIIFLYLYKQTIQETYGKNTFWWFFALLVVNIINLGSSSLFYSSKSGTFIGMAGKQGVRGKAGEGGDLQVCGFCKNKDEIGLVYSTQSYSLGKLKGTTSLTGELTFWRPYGQNGLQPIGDAVYQGAEGGQDQHYLVGIGGKNPVDYDKIIYLPDEDLTFWRVVAPKGYLSLGDLVMKGKAKPENYHSVCLNQKCISETEISQVSYLATYPEFTEIPEGGDDIKFLSVWMTNLNTFYISYSGMSGSYSNNTLWYNLVRGNSEYYDHKEKKADTDKIDDFVKFLKSKVSVIPRDTNTQLGLTVNASFIENQTDSNGKIVLYVFNGQKYADDIKELNEQQFWLYYIEIIKIVLLLYHKLGRNGIEFKYLDSIEDLSVRQTAYLLDNLFPSRSGAVNDVEFNEEFSKDYDIEFVVRDLETIINSFLGSPTSVLLQLNGQKVTGWEKRRYQFSKLLSTQLANASKGEEPRNYLKPIINKLARQGMVLSKESTDFMGSDFEQLNQQKGGSISLNKKLASKVKNQKKLYDNLNLYDDLVYLFPSSFNEQIAVDEEGLVYGGYLISGNDPMAIQRRNFINYLRTLLKPNRKTYYFLDKCLVFPNSDPDRKKLILDIKTIYANIDQQLASLNNYQNCANPREVQRYYQLMIRRMDKYFRNIKDYQGKLSRQEFYYFSTGRLRWLIEELNKYLEFIKGRCVSDEHVKISSQVRLLIQTNYSEGCLPDFNSSEFKQKLGHINNYVDKIAQNQLKDFKTTELKFLRDKLRNSKNHC